MSSSFAKKLADSDKKTRDKTFVAVAKWLGARETITALEAKKLWRGLFYSYWHADGRATQLDVANKMGALVHDLNRDVAMAYIEAFMWTMRTEWGGIDKHRLDKYCLLSRRVTHHALRFVGERGWDASEALAGAMASGIFGDSNRGIGFKLHIAGSFLRELEAVCAGVSGLELEEGEEEVDGGVAVPIASEDLSRLVETFVQALQREESAVLHKRMREELFAPLADASRMWDKPGAPRLTPNSMKKLCEVAITLGAENGVDDACREALYQLHALLKKGASKTVKEATARGEDPETEEIAPAKKKKKAAKNGVEMNGKKEKKKKKKKSQKIDGGADENDDDAKEAATKEKKRRKREKRLAEEEAMEKRSTKKQKKAKKRDAEREADVANGSSEPNGSKLLAMRALDRANTASPTPSLESYDSGSMSPRSKRLMWNDDAVTYSFPDVRGPINTNRGKRNLRLTPTKTIFRPIHGKTHKAPLSAPNPSKTSSKLGPSASKSKRPAESFF